MTRPSMPRQFVCAGSLNADITFQLPRMPREHEKLRVGGADLGCGGSAANTAYWLARLGARVRMLGCVGADALGDCCVDGLAGAGVDTALVQRSGRSATGMAAIFVNPFSKRMVTAGGANMDFDPQAVPAGVFRPGVHLHLAFSSPEPALPLLRMAKAGGASTSCDLDGLPGPELVPLVDFCFVNRTDLSRAWGGVGLREAWRRLGGLALVVTLGAEGAGFADAGGECFASARRVAVVDRTGGGDAFDAGFLQAWAQGLDWPACLDAGLALAAGVIAAPGSRPSLAGLE